MVEQGAIAEVEDLCIERLLKESEKRGLEQRTGWAKRRCGGGSNDCTSRSLLRKEELPSFGSGVEAERAQLELNGGEPIFSRPLEAGSQCKERVEPHWRSSMPQDGKHVEREMDTSRASQCDRGESEQQLVDAARCEITYDTVDNRGPGWRLAFEPCRAVLEACCRKKEISFVELGSVLSQALAVVETRLERCSQPKGDLFPLPLASDLGLHGQRIPNSDALIRALNLLYGTKTKTRAKEEGIRRSLTERLNQVVLKSNLLEENLPQLDFHRLFQSKMVDYSGEEVQVARSFQWKMIEAAMPEAVGSLELESSCDGGTLNYVRESWWSSATGRRSARGC